MVLVFNKFIIKSPLHRNAARTPPCCLDDAVEKTRSDWTEERLRHALFNVLRSHDELVQPIHRLIFSCFMPSCGEM